MVYLTWGHLQGRPFAGRGPLSWAHTTARLQSEAERSLADEAGGPVAQLIGIPGDGGDGEGDDPLAELKAESKDSPGQGVVVGNHGERLGRRHERSSKTRLAAGAAGSKSSGRIGKINAPRI